jgi:trk system potassium uptake protein TrkH
MHFSVIARVLGLLMMIFSFTLVPPMLISLLYQDGTLNAFLYALLITFGIGLVAWLPVRNHKLVGIGLFRQLTVIFSRAPRFKFY